MRPNCKFTEITNEKVVNAFNTVERNLVDSNFRNSEEMPAYSSSNLADARHNDVSQFIRNIETRLKGWFQEHTLCIAYTV